MSASNHWPEFGRSGDGIINRVYKSGANELHGTAFEFLRNSVMDANSFYNNANGAPLANFKRNQFGFSFGGPVIIPKLYNGRNKTFFFGDYEGLRQVTPSTVRDTVPTALQRAGDFSQTFASTRRPGGAYPQFTSVGLLYPQGGNSFYNAGQLKVEKRFSHGLNFLVAYTKQKLIDDNSIIENAGRNAPRQNIYNRRGDRSVSANDISQRFVFSGIYELPFGRRRRLGSGWNPLLEAALGGWQLNGILTLQTGFPLNVLNGANTTLGSASAGNESLRPNNNGRSAKLEGPVESRLNRYFDTSVFSPAAPFTFGNTGRTLPDVRGPGVRNVDFSLFKNFRIKERVTAQLRGEAFNATNTVQFGLPNTTLNSNQFGRITSQANSPRQLQVGLKLAF
jgi:hypothetical protein